MIINSVSWNFFNGFPYYEMYPPKTLDKFRLEQPSRLFLLQIALIASGNMIWLLYPSLYNLHIILYSKLQTLLSICLLLQGIHRAHRFSRWKCDNRFNKQMRKACKKLSSWWDRSACNVGNITGSTELDWHVLTHSKLSDICSYI